ncbi:hypothetical protein ACFX1Z_019195 [Malus domestica]
MCPISSLMRLWRFDGGVHAGIRSDGEGEAPGPVDLREIGPGLGREHDDFLEGVGGDEPEMALFWSPIVRSRVRLSGKGPRRLLSARSRSLSLV